MKTPSTVCSAVSRRAGSLALIAGGMLCLGLAANVLAQADFQVLHTFPEGAGDGRNAYAGVVEGGDGMLYGTTTFGGTVDLGTFYRMNKDGSGYAQLYSFGTVAGDTRHPFGTLVEGSAGVFYGTSYDGGASGNGAIYRINADGSGAAVIKSFSGGDGRISYSPLMRGSDGLLYGTTYFGGNSGVGVVFKVGLDGSGYQILHHFTSSGGDGANAFAGLLEGSDGWLFGSTQQGGSAGLGTLFKISKDGLNYSVLVQFAGGADGKWPRSALIESSDGTLYGETLGGGVADKGIVFKLNKDGSGYTVLRMFSNGAVEGQYPTCGFVEMGGVLYGGAYSGGAADRGAVFKVNKDGSGFEVLKSFLGVDGQYVGARLVNGRDGYLYGTTTGNNNYGQGGGTSTVFRISVALPPTIARQPSNTTVSTGDTATFSVEVGGSLPMSYQWQRDGVDIEGATGPTCTVANVTPAQAGSYRVVVSNAAKTITSAEAQLSILDLAMYAGLTIVGKTGGSYRIDASNDMNDPNGWTTVTTITLPESVYFWVDRESAGLKRRFYRAVLQ